MGTIPFGWRQNDVNDEIIESVPVELAALEKAKIYIKTGQYSFRELSDWLYNATGRRISHVGLYKILKKDKK